MSYYLPSVDATDEHHWQRYNIALDGSSLAEVRACVEREATSSWTFKLLQASISSLLDPVYTFVFKEPSDVVILHRFSRDDNYFARSR